MSMKVLIADTDWRFCQLTTSYLETHAHLVVQHSQEQAALQAARQWKPDLVIVAAELTESGLLESLHELPHPPAVLLVGWMDRYDRVWRAWQRGGDELLLKPIFTTEELHAAIVMALENATASIRKHRLAASA